MEEAIFITFPRHLYDKPALSATIRVLWKMFEYVKYNTNFMYMTSGRRKEIINACNISETSYYRAINELVECGIVEKCEGIYYINSEIFWKGDEETREKLLKKPSRNVP